MTVLKTNPVFIKEVIVGESAKVDGSSVICGIHLEGMELLGNAIESAGLNVSPTASNAAMVRLNTGSEAQAEQLLSMVSHNASIIGVPRLSQRQKVDGTPQLVLEFDYPEFLLTQIGQTLTPESRPAEVPQAHSYSESPSPVSNEGTRENPMRSDDDGFIDIGEIDLEL